MLVSLDVYSTDNVNFDLYCGFEWLTEPNNLKKDVFAISHGSQFNFQYTKSYADIYNPYGGGQGAVIPYTEDHTHLVYCGDTSIYNGQVGGNSFTFQLGYRGIGEGCFYNGSNYAIIYSSGIIYTRATKVGSGSCELNVSYLHQQKFWTITTSVNIPLGGSLSMTNTTSYDPTNLPYLLKF